MDKLIIICEPDEKGVYSIENRYLNTKKYTYKSASTDAITDCPACGAYQKKTKNGKCVVCGCEIERLDIKEFLIFMEKNKQKIDYLKRTYGTGLDMAKLEELKKIICEMKEELGIRE
ncbi:MAG: hypothetical protein U0M42_09295 [Acutalibacteraceae bacterium]|nr:hypothetical protein [Acutalibacteraceae bacterium]